MQNYCVLDIESSGLDVLNSRILELGVMVVKDHKPLEAISRVVDAGVEVDPEVTKVTGITQEMVNGGESINLVLDWFRDLTNHLPLVGHNIFIFDHRLLLAESKRNKHPLMSELPLRRLVDTAALFKGLQLKMKPEEDESHFKYAARVLSVRRRGIRFNLKYACETLHIPIGGVIFHTATGDIEVTQKLYERMRIEVGEPKIGKEWSWNGEGI